MMPSQIVDQFHGRTFSSSDEACEWLLRAINAAVVAERKACISVVFGLCLSDNNAQEIAAAIRARGQT